MRYKTDKARAREKRGTGTGVEYKPWIRTGEFGSLGTTATPIDWITGRQVHLLSQSEQLAWYILRFDEENIDIREQFDLDLTKTLALSEQLGIQHPRSPKTKDPIVMTTDLLVTRSTGKLIAFSVKDQIPDPKSKKKKDRRVIEKLNLEKAYWDSEGVEYFIIIGRHLNRVFAHNIRLVTTYYNLPDYELDDIGYLKHLIARHLITVDMETEILDFATLAENYRKEVTLCRNTHLESVMCYLPLTKRGELLP